MRITELSDGAADHSHGNDSQCVDTAVEHTHPAGMLHGIESERSLSSVVDLPKVSQKPPPPQVTGLDRPPCIRVA
jgi:hypothetical protein